MMGSMQGEAERARCRRRHSQIDWSALDVIEWLEAPSARSSSRWHLHRPEHWLMKRLISTGMLMMRKWRAPERFIPFAMVRAEMHHILVQRMLDKLVELGYVNVVLPEDASEALAQS